eukprot:Phypoly_transcript_11693.p1 GENE.Phypoly_transcript_11693~~Phypoly_transcript_11693.p1  ORF type:complete len:362 (-),score=45.45 Phypoly_transcript_11693:27-1112(-)
MVQPSQRTRGITLTFIVVLLFTFVILYHSILHTQYHNRPHPPSSPTDKRPPLIQTTSSPSPSLPATPPIILYWTPVSGFMGKTWLKTPDRCPVTCEFTESQSKLERANAVVFLLPSFASASSFPKKHPNQYFVGLSMESDQYYRHMNDKKFMSNFELTMTYKTTSNITTMYMSSKANYSNPPDPKTADALVSIFISNSGPLNRRNELMSALLELVPCHSFGRYKNNKKMDPNEDKKKTLRRYKFHLASENSDTPDYVTEKFYQALEAGTVPIYMGAPNIDQFAPSNHSIIKVADFDYNYEKLAEYLLYLDKHDDEYQKYLEWKKHPLTGNFKKLQDYVKVDARCKLCMFLNGLPLPKLDLT